MNYDSYIKSKQWQSKKEKFYKSNRYKKQRGRCYCCRQLFESSYHRHLHHKTYDRLGDERINDLVAVCDRCHSRIHELTDLGTPLKNAHIIAKKFKNKKKFKKRKKAKNPKIPKVSDEEYQASYEYLEKKFGNKKKTHRMSDL